MGFALQQPKWFSPAGDDYFRGGLRSAQPLQSLVYSWWACCKLINALKGDSTRLHTLRLSHTFSQPSRPGRRAGWHPSSPMSRSEEGPTGWQAGSHTETEMRQEAEGRRQIYIPSKNRRSDTASVCQRVRRRREEEDAGEETLIWYRDTNGLQEAKGVRLNYPASIKHSAVYYQLYLSL